MTNTSACPNCAGTRIATGGHIDAGEGKFLLVMNRNPSAAIFKGGVKSRARISVCGDCGFVHLFATEPEKLYEAFLTSQGK
jgi:hypothetical protein